MASGPFILWLIEGEKVGAVADFLSLGSKITLDSECTNEIKRLLLLRRKAMTKLDSALKGRDIILLRNIHIVKAMVFPVVMHRSESWTKRRQITEELMPLSCGAGEES